ncbi:MAG: mechanosensitive ion channel, partial [Gemmatimonadota bacterium]|nr:mechanosensitive ion channel [Gemmatimonadota bacterium]
MIDVYVDRLWEWLISSLADLVLGLLIALASWLVSRWVKRFVSRTAKRLGWDEILWDYFGTVLRYLTLIVGWVSALKKTGFPVEAVLATFGISGIIIGLGARRSIANYFSGLMMLAARPFKQGDLIEFGPPPQIGRVT